MKKIIIIAAATILMSATPVWAGDKYDGAVNSTTPHEHGHRIEEGHKASGHAGEMTHKMSEKERGPMVSVDAYKKSSDRLQGERGKMTHKMDGHKQGAMSNTASQEHGHRLK